MIVVLCFIFHPSHIPQASGDDTTEMLTFAVPKKGRLFERVLKLLSGAGLEFDRPERQVC